MLLVLSGVFALISALGFACLQDFFVRMHGREDRGPSRSDPAQHASNAAILGLIPYDKAGLPDGDRENLQSTIAAGGTAPISRSRAMPPALPAKSDNTSTPKRSNLCRMPASAH